MNFEKFNSLTIVLAFLLFGMIISYLFFPRNVYLDTDKKIELFNMGRQNGDGIGYVRGYFDGIGFCQSANSTNSTYTMEQLALIRMELLNAMRNANATNPLLG